MDNLNQLHGTSGTAGGIEPIPINSFPEEEADEGYWDGIAWEVKTEAQRLYIMHYEQYLLGRMKPRNLFARICWWFVGRIWRKYLVKPTKTIAEFFVSVKNSKEELMLISERIDGYKSALQRAEESGQKAMKEEIESQIKIIGLESKLYAVKLRRLITEEQLIKFVKESPKGLRLDLVANFSRVIPDKVLKVKKRCDELEIFDNYAVLHYDPDSKSYKMTSKEKKEKKERDEARVRDPILFGLIEGSRKLYLVGDWVDEYCDLTFDAMIKKFGAKEINKNSIKKEIS